MKYGMSTWSVCLLVLALFGGSLTLAGEPASKDAKPASEADAKNTEAPDAKKEAPPAAPAKVKVAKGPLKIEVTLDGVFEAQQMSEIVLRPQEWSGLTVLSAVEHGTQVKRGDLLLALELDKIDRAIADLRAELQVTDLTMRQAEQALRTLEATTPMDIAAVQRAERIAKEESQRFFTVDRPMQLKAIEFTLKMSKEALEYQEEELRQLEKMYKADEITEATEEVILRRARNAVDRARFMYERAKVEHEYALKHDVPRTDEKVKDSTQRALLLVEKDRLTLPVALQKQRLDLEKAKILRARADEKLTKLMADREMMTVRAPVDGVVYYGKCVRGRWGAGTAGAEELRRGGSVMPNAVIMTVVQPRPIFVRTVVAEKDLCNVRPGLKGTAVAKACPDVKLTAILDRVAAVPSSGGTYDARATVALAPAAQALMPGMNCDVKLTVYEKKDALTVPPAAVATDESDDQKHHVFVPDKGGKPVKRAVTIGKKTDKLLEIVKGLREGEEILAEAPKDKK
jgi:multidrug resistance efflux pump